MRRLGMIGLVLAAMAAGVLVAPSAALADGNRCTGWTYSGNYRARICATIEFLSGQTVQATGWVESNTTSSQLHIDDIELWRREGNALIARCSTDGAGCPTGYPRTSRLGRATGPHGPCRRTQGYLSVAAGLVIFPNGVSRSLRITSNVVSGIATCQAS